MYLELSGSDLEGNIKNRHVIELLYAIMCTDEAAHSCKVTMPDIAFPAVAREVLELYQTCGESFIDGEDYSYISMEKLAEAFIIYLKETGRDIKDIHRMSRYDLAADLMHTLAV